MNRQKAIAVRYDESLPAPFIAAKGKGELAAAIKKIAETHDIQIVQSPELAENLIQLDVGSFIPEAYYAIIAEILVFVRNLQERK
jgi:type III secretion system FlhB-like substrate exporter